MSTIRFSLNKKFHLLQSKTAVWESGKELIDHFRIIFIISGEGNFILNGKVGAYLPEGILFLAPGETAIFQEDQHTEVFQIAFDTYLSDNFQQKKIHSPDFADTYKRAENLCNDLRLCQGKPIQNKRESETVTYLIGQIAFEATQKPASHVNLIKGSIDLITTILARNNFETRKIEEENIQQTVTSSMVRFLTEQIQQNKTVRIPELLLKFNISEEAANLCFINQTGMSLKNFIFKYKADLFKSRMLKVDIREISPTLCAGDR